MAFMQIIEFRTSATDEIHQVDEDWRRARREASVA
jgi:hypothetical protein